nr:immunoglobulin heavy chain junction region [Mus musculus]MBK4190121.1 immunoglobulin heavy chain junction region [Mus musculus]
CAGYGNYYFDYW